MNSDTLAATGTGVDHAATLAVCQMYDDAKRQSVIRLHERIKEQQARAERYKALHATAKPGRTVKARKGRRG